MKIPRLLPSLLLCAAVTLPGFAAFQSARPADDNLQPQYPSILLAQGITRGRALIAVSIGDNGRVKEMLPLAYSSEYLARASMEALRDWRFTPAELDGHPVPVQTEMAFDYTVQGAVITANIINHFFYDNFDDVGDYALIYRPGDATRLDRAPVRIGGELPKYASGAAENGVRGRVQVRFYIDEKGDVRLPAATAAVDPYLMEQAVTAVRSWKFQPVTSRGRPVLVIAQQEFNFANKP